MITIEDDEVTLHIGYGSICVWHDRSTKNGEPHLMKLTVENPAEDAPNSNSKPCVNFYIKNVEALDNMLNGFALIRERMVAREAKSLIGDCPMIAQPTYPLLTVKVDLRRESSHYLFSVDVLVEFSDETKRIWNTFVKRLRPEDIRRAASEVNFNDAIASYEASLCFGEASNYLALEVYKALLALREKHEQSRAEGLLTYTHEIVRTLDSSRM